MTNGKTKSLAELVDGNCEPKLVLKTFRDMPNQVQPLAYILSKISWKKQN